MYKVDIPYAAQITRLKVRTYMDLPRMTLLCSFATHNIQLGLNAPMKMALQKYHHLGMIQPAEYGQDLVNSRVLTIIREHHLGPLVPKFTSLTQRTQMSTILAVNLIHASRCPHSKVKPSQSWKAHRELLERQQRPRIVINSSDLCPAIRLHEDRNLVHFHSKLFAGAAFVLVCEMVLHWKRNHLIQAAQLIVL